MSVNQTPLRGEPHLRGDRRISRAFVNAPRLPINNSSKIVIVSDCHRSTNDQNDNFAVNSNIYFNAMRRYYDQGYTYIELGDGDELWENKNFGDITDANSHVFWLLGKFRCEGRLHMLYGNHDMVKMKGKWCRNNLSEYYCERAKCGVPLFDCVEVSEGIILDHAETGRSIYLLHGHQGDLLNDRLWRLARFLVRYIWRPLELLGFRDPTNTAKNRSRQNKTESRLSGWAERRGAPPIAGHTHRPVFPAPGEPLYFNDGSCVHPRCITAIEITGGAVTLVKWGVETREDGTLYVDKTPLVGPVRIERLFDGKINYSTLS